jgi:hypothetical protein
VKDSHRILLEIKKFDSAGEDGQVKLIFADWANTLKQRLDKLSGRE